MPRKPSRPKKTPLVAIEELPALADGTEWASRIVGERMVDPEELLANPDNPTRPLRSIRQSGKFLDCHKRRLLGAAWLPWH